MKKFWEKHDLFKMSGLVVLLYVVLTWVIPKGQFQTELVIGEITRIGIFDFFQYGLLGMWYFTTLVTFLFVLGGFYQLMSKSGGYQKLTSKVAKVFKGKEIIFVVAISLIIAILSAVMTEYFVLIALIPFIIAIMSKLKLDKMTSFVTTFGAILVGVIGSIYNTKVAGAAVSQLGTEYTTLLWAKLTLFGVAFIVLTAFNILHIRKTLNDKKALEVEDLFIGEESKKAKAWPIALVLGLFTLIALLAYMPWEQAFNISLFSDLLTKFNEFTILDTPIFAYFFGEVLAFGDWDIFGIQFLMLIAALIIKWVSGIKTADFLTAFGEGFAKVGKLVILLLTAYLALEFAVMFPVLVTITDYLMGLVKGFNVFFGVLSGIIASVFSIEYQYTLSLIGTYMATTYSSFANQIGLMLQATYGLVSFIAPTSVILLIGLSYCNINFREWFKFIWKFLLIMFIVIIVILLVI